MGFLSYEIFHKLTYRTKKSTTYEEFIDSKLFTSFVNFGKFASDIYSLDLEQYIRFLLKLQVKLDDWRNPSYYNEFLIERCKTENYEAALERNLLLMKEWSINNNKTWTNFFMEIHPQQACLWIKGGRISPWVLYNCETGLKLFHRFNNEQLSMIEKIVDIEFWKMMFQREKNHVVKIRKILKEVGL